MLKMRLISPINDDSVQGAIIGSDPATCDCFRSTVKKLASAGFASMRRARHLSAFLHFSRSWKNMSACLDRSGALLDEKLLWICTLARVLLENS